MIRACRRFFGRKPEVLVEAFHEGDPLLGDALEHGLDARIRGRCEQTRISVTQCRLAKGEARGRF